MNRIASFFMNGIKRISSRFPSNPKRSYISYSQALADSDTYEDDDVVEMVSLKTKKFKESLEKDQPTWLHDLRIIQNLFVISYISVDKPLMIVELGGACGGLFFSLNHSLPGVFETWTIIETPGMTKKAKQMFENPKLKFVSINDFENDPSLQKGDLLIAQGVLQYLEDPLSFFESIQGMDFHYIYLTRTVVSDKIQRPIITKQVVNVSDHGPGKIPEGFVDRKTSQPVTIIPLDILMSKIQHTYQVQFLFAEGTNRTETIDYEKIETKNIGILLKQKIMGEPL